MNKAPAPEKSFDCVEMKRRIQERIYAETRGMDQEELLGYFRRRVAASRFAPFFGLRPDSESAKRGRKKSGTGRALGLRSQPPRIK